MTPTVNMKTLVYKPLFAFAEKENGIFFPVKIRENSRTLAVLERVLTVN
jgi:hypothetical protein